MSVYVIGQLEIRNRSWVEQYGPKTDALIAKYGGRCLVRAGAVMESLEGQESLPNAVVILEFPSMEHAKAWYADPDYAEMIRLRRTGSDANIMLVGND